VRGYNGVQAGHNAVNAAQAFSQGNIPGGLSYLAAAAANMASLFGACFAAGTPLLTPDGHKSIEDFKPGDWILSAPEDNPEAPPEAKRVEEVFTSVAALLELRVGDRVIRTTEEHPFFVLGRGWTAARELMAGDRLRSHNERSVVLDEVVRHAEEVPVYNLRVADYHTYFVGSSEWGFSVWAHNTCTGQLHHAISRRVITQLQRHATLAGRYVFRDARFATRALNRTTHLGYQRWHRRLDAAVAGWVERNGTATAQQFESYLRRIYSQGQLGRMFPNGL
jgi:hypothetical protein